MSDIGIVNGKTVREGLSLADNALLDRLLSVTLPRKTALNLKANQADLTFGIEPGILFIDEQNYIEILNPITVAVFSMIDRNGNFIPNPNDGGNPAENISSMIYNRWDNNGGQTNVSGNDCAPAWVWMDKDQDILVLQGQVRYNSITQAKYGFAADGYIIPPVLAGYYHLGTLLGAGNAVDATDNSDVILTSTTKDFEKVPQSASSVDFPVDTEEITPIANGTLDASNAQDVILNVNVAGLSYTLTNRDKFVISNGGNQAIEILGKAQPYNLFPDETHTFLSVDGTVYH